MEHVAETAVDKWLAIATVCGRVLAPYVLQIAVSFAIIVVAISTIKSVYRFAGALLEVAFSVILLLSLCVVLSTIVSPMCKELVKSVLFGIDWKTLYRFPIDFFHNDTAAHVKKWALVASGHLFSNEHSS